MFGIEYYPSPPDVIDQLLADIDTGGVILEPSAGSGAIVAALVERGAKRVLACEIDAELREILKAKNCEIIGHDFLTTTADRISHIDAVVMNPPFSSADKHILHAWEIVPPGTEIRALCNADTLKNEYSERRKTLNRVIAEHGSWEDLGPVFADADRRTEVKVALIRLRKPGASGQDDYDGFFITDNSEEHQEIGLMPYNAIRDVVNRYVEACRIYDKQLDAGIDLRRILYGFFGADLGIQVTQDGRGVALNDFKKDLQRAGWKYIFDKLDLTKIVTQGLRETINKFIEKQNHIPFTMRNIYRMLEIIAGTTGSRMDAAILEVFDKITMHHHDNRHYPNEGWKTNSHYLVNQTFILPNMAGLSYSGGIDDNYYSRSYWELVEDLVKALCFITGDAYESMGSLRDRVRCRYAVKTADAVWFYREYDGTWDSASRKEKELHDAGIAFEIVDHKPTWGQWFEWAYFDVKAYKKGTMHFRFRDPELWARFNHRVANIKGFPLPAAKKKEPRAQQVYDKEQQQFSAQQILFAMKQEAI